MLLLATLLSALTAFVSPSPLATKHSSLKAFESSSVSTAAFPTLDPTTALSDVFGTLLNTPLILAVPISAALLIASGIAYFIISYASPADPDE